MFRFNICLSLVLLIFCNVYAHDFQKVDAYTRTVSKTEDYKIMAKRLTEPFPSQREKVRALFVWITDNVRYDFEKYQNDLRTGGYTRIYGRNQKEIELKRQKIKQEKIIKTYRTQKGVCEDYSVLFEAMCISVGIEAKTITGYARFNPSDIGRHTRAVNHAWNSVKIDGAWYLLDATWAAGTTDLQTGIFTKKFQEGFFMTAPELFIMNHFPEDSKWQLLPKVITFESFSNFPYLHDGYYDYKVIDYNPKTAFLQSEAQFSDIQLVFQDLVPEIFVFENGNMLNVKRSGSKNTVNLKIPLTGKTGKHIIIGVKNHNYFDPIIEYKIK